MIGCLVIHGYTGGPHEIAPLVDFLRENTGWRVEVPTLPGHGRNLRLTPENVSHKRWIGAVEQTLQSMFKKYDSIYIIGFSMGGMIAAYLAAKHDVKKLVLLAPSFKYLSWRQLLLDVFDFVIDGIKGGLHKNKVYLRYRRKIGVVPFKANLEFFRLVQFTKNYLKDVDIPVLIAQGQKDGVVPYKTAYYLEKEMTSEQTEVVFFERSKHLICLGDDKDILNKIVHHFLKKNE